MSSGISAPVSHALDISCPTCGAEPKEPCTEKKENRAPHVERGRMARWAAMGIPVLPASE